MCIDKKCMCDSIHLYHLYESIHFKPSTNIFYLFKNAVIYIYAY